MMQRKLGALGRLKPGEMNKTEREYANLLTLKERAGEILWWKFEAIKLRLADNTFYSPDFFILNAQFELEAHEVKGAMAIFQDDAKVKVKVASAMFPFRFFVAIPKPKNKGGGWEIIEY